MPKDTHLEHGHFFVTSWGADRVAIESNDFNRDAALEVWGDFGDLEAKRLYAQAIADALNKTLPIFIPQPSEKAQ